MPGSGSICEGTPCVRKRRRWVHKEATSWEEAGDNSKPPPKDGKPAKPPPARRESDDDVEDGDMATPKRDRDGDDDQPL